MLRIVIGNRYHAEMRLQQLRYLDVAIREGSLRRAAEALGMSQPSLSEQLRRLEEELDLVLLMRSRTGVRPTESATQLLPHIHSLLSAEQTVTEEASAIRGLLSGRVRVGAVATAIRVLLHELVPEFRSAYPNVRIELWESESAAVCARVSAGTLDLGVIGLLLDEERPVWLSGLVVTNLCQESLVLCVPRDHPLSSGRILISDLVDQAWISHGSGFIYTAASSRLFPGEAPKPVFHTNDPATAMVMVAAGVGLAFLPRSATVRPPTERIVVREDLRQIPLPAIDLALVRRADTPSPPAARQLTTMLRARAGAISGVPARSNPRALSRPEPRG